MPTFALVTFGGKVNQYESQTIREGLQRRGYSEVRAGEGAELYVVNTCTVTETAHKEAEKTERYLKARVAGRPNDLVRARVTGARNGELVCER